MPELVDHYSSVQAAGTEFLKKIKDIERPDQGAVADFLDDKPKKGLNALMRALGEVIGEQGDITITTANKELIERLRELCEKSVRDASGEKKAHPYDPVGDLLTVAYPQEDEIEPHDIPAERAKRLLTLRTAFQHNRRPIFDEILRVIKDIAIDKKIEVEGQMDDMTGGDPDKPKPNTPTGGWRKSLPGDGPAVDDQAIKRSADQFDKDKPPVNEDDIRKSAAGDHDFSIGDSHLTEYERGEGGFQRDIERLQGLGSEKTEVMRYYKLVKQLKAAFNETLGTCLEPSGVTPSTKK